MALRDESDDLVVELVRERQPGDDAELVGTGLTFSRAPDGDIYVAAMNPGSVAEKSRKFGRGQLVKAINGWSVHGLSEDKVWEMCLGPERTRVQIALGEKPLNPDEEYTFHPSHTNALESRARFKESKDNTSVPGYVGISLDTGISGKHRIVAIVPGGPTSGYHSMRVGDILLSIDGIPISRKSSEEVKQMIAGPAGSWITLEMQRPGIESARLAVQRVAKLDTDRQTSTDENEPGPDGVRAQMMSRSRPATVTFGPTPGPQHGAFLDNKIMKEVKPEMQKMQQGTMIANAGQKQLLMEHTEKGVFSKEVAANAPELLKMPAGTVQVSIYYAQHLPVKTMFGLTDTYVRATYEGKMMKTRTVRLSLDPKFDTVMRFPSGDCVNGLEVTVLQVGGIGSDLEIGSVLIPYRDIARGVNKEFALIDRGGAAVVGLKGKTAVLYLQATADMREQDVAETAHRRAEREWAAQAMALATEAQKWPDWMPSDHSKYGMDPDAVGSSGLKESEQAHGLTLRMEEDFKDAKKHERVFAQHLINDLCLATDAKHSRFQYVGIEQGSVLATINVLPSKDPRDTRTAKNIVSEITIQTYDASSKLRRLPCTYTVRNAHAHPPRKPPTRATWGLRSWIEGITSSSPKPPHGPDEGAMGIADDELGGEHKPVFGAMAALPVLNRVSEMPAPPAPSQHAQHAHGDGQQQQQQQQQQQPAQQPAAAPASQKPVGFFASASVLDRFMGGGASQSASAQPQPTSTLISNKHALAGQDVRAQGTEEQADPSNVAALFNSLMTSFAGRHPFDAAQLQRNGTPCQVKVLVKQARHVVHARTRPKVYFCVSLLAVGSRLESNVTHKIEQGAHMESLDPETLDRSEQSPLNKYELVAQYRGLPVGVNSDLATFEWEESVKLRECVAAVDKNAPLESKKEGLKGQPVQMLVTLHSTDVAVGDETLGWTLVPITPEMAQLDHWFPLMDTAGAIKNVDRHQACVHLSYSYAPVGAQAQAEEEAESGEVEEKPNSRIDRSLIPTDVVHADKAPGPDSVAGRSVSEVTSVPPTGNFEFHAVKNAVRGIKALVANGYEIVLVGCGEVNTARKAMTALKRVGLVDEDKSPVKLSNVMFVDTAREKAQVAKQLGGFVAVVDRDWEALGAVVEELEDGTQCMLFNPTREGRRKYLEAVMKREAEEAELAALTVQLARERGKLRTTELTLARVGVDMRAQSRYTPKEQDPAVRNMVESYIADEMRVAETADKVKALMASTVSPLLSVPTTRNELGLVPKRKPDGWEEACASLGLDASLLAVYDERPTFSQLLKPSPADPPPFYPLALANSTQAILRMPHRIEAWEIAKRKGLHPASDICGVGVTVAPGARGELFVRAVEYGGPAFASRAVSAGDKLVSVDGEVLLGMDERDVKRMLDGKVGTVVLLELVKEGEEEPQTVVLERKETVPVFREGKGRVMVALEGVVLYPQVDNDVQKSGLVRITVGTASHLPRVVDVEAMFCLVKISQPMSTGQPTVHRSDLVPVSPPPFATSLFDAKFESQVEDLAKQTVTVELYWPDPHRRSGTLLGACQLTCEQLVAGKGFRSMTVLDHAGKPIKGTDAADCKLQLAGELLPEKDAAEKLMEQARMSHASSLALGAQDTVGVSLVLDEDFDSTVGYEQDKRLAFANELRLDLAAALYTAEERFVVCGLQPGSVVAHVNIMQDLSGADPREPRALAKLLTNQVVDKASPLHWAATTRKCVSITTAPAFKAPKGAHGAQHIPDGAPGAARELAPRERAAGMSMESQAERERRQLLGLSGGAGVGAGGPVIGKPERALTHKERQGASLNALAAGMMRSKEPGLFAEPAVVSLTFSENVERLESPAKQAQIHSDIADILYLPTQAIEIGGYDAQRRALDVAVFPFSKRAADKIKENMELARKMVPGVQHMIAAQLVSQVFDKTSQLWQLPGLDGIEWAQIVKDPRHENTKLVVRRMKGEDLERDPTGAVGFKAEAARQSQHKATLGEGLKSSAAGAEKVWVASPTLGMAWEELVDRTGEPYWVNHKEKLVSYSHPKYHWPLPRGWTEHVDDRRRVYYSAPGKKRTQWEHPCSPSVVYGVVIQGYSEAAVQLRDWVRTNGWKDIASKLAAEAWAKDFRVEEEGVRTRLLEAPAGQAVKVAAAYTFKMKWEEVPMKERGMQPLPPPAIGEDFVSLDANMVALMMTQYPAGYYILFRPTLQRVKAAQVAPNSHPARLFARGFTTVWVTCRSTSGEVIHRKVTVVGRDKKGAHPGYTGRFEGWAITEVEEAWLRDPAQLLERGLMFSSIAVLLQTHPEEFVIRVDPDQEIPSCRFVRKTWGNQGLPPDLVEDQEALSRPLVRQKDVQAAREQAEHMKQFAGISPEVQEALLTMGTIPTQDAIGGIAEQEAAAFAQGLSEVDILPFDERPGFREVTVHLRRSGLRPGNTDGLSGIGVVLQALHNPDDPYMVVEVEPTGPAGISQQVEVGDVLLAVDSYQTKHLTLGEVINRIKGPPFAPVTLFLRRKDDGDPEKREADTGGGVFGDGVMFQ